MLLSFEALKKLESTSIHRLRFGYGTNFDGTKGDSKEVVNEFKFGYGTNFDGTESMVQI